MHADPGTDEHHHQADEAQPVEEVGDRTRTPVGSVATPPDQPDDHGDQHHAGTTRAGVNHEYGPTVNMTPLLASDATDLGCFELWDLGGKGVVVGLHFGQRRLHAS